MFMANGKNDHLIMCILHLPLAVFQFLNEIGKFCIRISWKARTVSTILIQMRISSLPFAVNAILNLPIVKVVLTSHTSEC